MSEFSNLAPAIAGLALIALGLVYSRLILPNKIGAGADSPRMEDTLSREAFEKEKAMLEAKLEVLQNANERMIGALVEAGNTQAGVRGTATANVNEVGQIVLRGFPLAESVVLESDR